ncbi:ATP-NAD kinase family protein [Candidatus Bathyarchaeota archaeon]|nr:ATP-NAD kinase family protein [Candidatus Bathyarchaeota archaeon]
MKKLGLIVNPVAGMGGRVGLKGSDGADTLRRAKELGAEPQAPTRTLHALQAIPKQPAFKLYTYPGEMGEDEARAAGIEPTVIGKITSGSTTPMDTRRAAAEMAELGVELLLFAGGDGTARDIYTAIDSRVPVLGIPSGVKIHSAVYAVTPAAAGRLAGGYLGGDSLELRDAEVMDIDEEAFRDNRVSARLYGYMKTPYSPEYMQGSKEGGTSQEPLDLEAIAGDIVDEMEPGTLYIVGPGSSTRPVATQLGLEKTLLGVDVIKDGMLVDADANEERILAHLDGQTAKIIVTVIGGQGFIFGRGNQQISPKVIRRVGKENIVVIATPQKLATLRGRPLRVDTGDPALDQKLKGYYKVITGYRRRTLIKVE